ncbi:MAG TPA: tetratricopeptide repeat protein [Candidatus Obscuribacterales bacterium]
MRHLLLALLLALLCAPNASALSGPDVERFRQLIQKANSLMMHKQFSAAIALYEEALQIDPDDPQCRSIVSLNLSETHNHWGIQYYSARHFKEAISQFQQAVKINPKNVQAKRNIDLAERAIAQMGGGDMRDDESHGVSYDEERVKEGAKAEDNDEEGSAFGNLSVKSDAASRDKQKAHKGPLDESGRTTPAAEKHVGDEFSSYSADDLKAGERSKPTDEPKSEGKSMSQLGDEPASGKAQVPVESPSSDTGQYGAVTIIQHQSSASTQPPRPMSNETPAPAASAPPYSSAASGMSTPVTQGAPASPYPPFSGATTGGAPPAGAYQQSPAPVPGAGSYRPANPTYRVLPKQFADQPAAPVPSFPPPAAPGTVSGAASGTPATSGGSLDDSLSSIEMKVLGQRQENLTVLQRLEKVESLTDGQVHTGTPIIERIEMLRKKYGL